MFICSGIILSQNYDDVSTKLIMKHYLHFKAYSQPQAVVEAINLWYQCRIGRNWYNIFSNKKTTTQRGYTFEVFLSIVWHDQFFSSDKFSCSLLFIGNGPDPWCFIYYVGCSMEADISCIFSTFWNNTYIFLIRAKRIRDINGC